MGWKEQELVFQMCWSISLTRVPGWEPACTQEEDVMSIIKNAEDETERSLKNIKAVGFLVPFGCLRLKLLLHALTAHEKLLNYSLFQLYALPFSCHWQVRQIITVSQHQMTSRHKINVLPLRCSRFRPIGVHQWESTNESNEGIWSDMRLSHWMVCREYDFNFILADAALGFQKEGLPWDETVVWRCLRCWGCYGCWDECLQHYLSPDWIIGTLGCFASMGEGPACQADEQTVAMIIQMKTLVEVGRVATSLPKRNAIWWLNHWITDSCV